MILPLQFASELRPKAQIKACPEDFRVDEVPLFEVSGQGDYAYFEVLKRAIPGHALVRAVAEHLDIPASQVATAGTKDRLAIARQRLSLPARFAQAGPPPMDEILEWKALGLHSQPLRPGLLKGNRFRVRLLGENLGPWLRKAWQRQQPVGWANYYGIQRFGDDNKNWGLGLAMLLNPPPRSKRKRWPHNFVLSSVQSQLFNEFLEKRVALGRFQALSPGDWCDTLPPSQPFPARGDADEKRAFLDFQISSLGPIWGYKLQQPTSEEVAAIEVHGLKQQSFQPFRAPGSRRATRLPLAPILECEADEKSLVLQFELPPGSYLTVFLEHFFRLELHSSDSGFSSGLEVPDDE